jgi:transaldolase
MSSEEPRTKKARLESNSAPSSPNGKNGNESVLNQLKNMTVIVSDTGEFSLIQQYSPQDATTNPSLILKAAQNKDYAKLIDSAIDYGLNHHKAHPHTSEHDLLELIMDKLSANFGIEISKLIPGYVSIEVDARLSFNTEETIRRAQNIIRLLAEAGVPKNRILIKVAATYEGIMAGKVLQEQGICCNLTLVFSIIQAALCAENHITLISPFVGRILDWHKAKTGLTYDAQTDPGVLSVKKIYQYFKKYNYNTIVMGKKKRMRDFCFSELINFFHYLGASFRNIGEIIALAGCDRLTIAPSLLEELKGNNSNLERVLEPVSAAAAWTGEKLLTDEPSFRYQLNEDAMATEKLSEGIRLFAADIIKLENIIKEKLHSRE